LLLGFHFEGCVPCIVSLCCLLLFPEYSTPMGETWEQLATP
jgi:hypothetical protein